MVLPLGDQNIQGRGLAYVTLGFIAINIAVFVLLQLNSDAFTYGYSTIPAEITGGVDLLRAQPITLEGQQVLIPQAPGPEPIYLTLISSMFMHGGWTHLLGNMLFLFIFGDNVEHTMGGAIYGLFYLAAGVVGTLAQVLLSPASVIPSLGASGAISGVLGAYLVMFPRNRVTVILFRILTSVPAIVAIGLWAAFQFVNGYASIATTQETTGGVAYMAHIGGFVAGVVVGLFFRGAAGRGLRPQGAF